MNSRASLRPETNHGLSVAWSSDSQSSFIPVIYYDHVGLASTPLWITVEIDQEKADQQGNRRILFTIPLAPLNPLLFLEMLDAGQDDAVGQC